jgi:uncharacterized protein HemX
MKGFLAVLLLGFIALSAFNFWQIRELKQEIAVLERKTQDQQRRADTSDRLMAQAADAIAHAGEALSHTDTRQAKDAFDVATRKVAEAGRALQQHAGPATNWLRDSADTLGKQVRGLVGGTTAPAASPR